MRETQLDSQSGFLSVGVESHQFYYLFPAANRAGGANVRPG